MQKKLGRRVVVFGRTIVFVWLLSVVAWLQKQDSLDLRDDVHDLKVIGAIEQIDSAENLQRLPGPSFDHALHWISSNRSHEDAIRVAVRTDIVEWLHDRGLDPERISRLSGKMFASSDSAPPFHVVQVLDLPQREQPEGDAASFWPSLQHDKVESPYEEDPYDTPKRRYVVTVAHLLDELEQLSTERQIAYASHVEQTKLASTYFTSDHPSVIVDRPPTNHGDERVDPTEFQLAETPQYGVPAPGIEPDLQLSPTQPHRTAHLDQPHGGIVDGPTRPREASMQPSGDLIFLSGLLSDEKINIRYEWLSPAPEMMQQQVSYVDQSKLVSVPVQTATMEAASLLELTDPDRPANDSLLALGTDPERMAYLRRTYGHMLLEDATGLASDGLTQGYRSLSLFGFSFSTRRFPMAVLVCLAAALWQTLAALVAVRRQGVRILVEIIDDATIEVLVSNRIARFALWIVLPLTGIWASLPLVRLPDNELQLLIVGTGLVAMLGAGCVGTAESKLRPLALDTESLADQIERADLHASPHFSTRPDRQPRSPLP